MMYSIFKYWYMKVKSLLKHSYLLLNAFFTALKKELPLHPGIYP